MGCNASAVSPYTTVSPHPPRKDHNDRKTGVVTILGRYRMSLAPEEVLGEGSFSICRKGTDLTTGRSVAIKAYKKKPGASINKKVLLTRLRTQVAVLKKLRDPFESPSSPELWSDQLMHA